MQSQSQSLGAEQSRSQQQSQTSGGESRLQLVKPAANGYDEMLLADGTARPHYAAYQAWLGSRSADWMERKRAEADLIFRRTGITFSVYGDETGTERLIPSDVVPRIIDAEDWDRLELGLTQRVKAINRFRRKEAQTPAAPAAPTTSEALLTEIRDALVTVPKPAVKAPAAAKPTAKKPAAKKS